MEKCRNCGNKKNNKPVSEAGEILRLNPTIFRCSKCGAIYGTCTLGESYECVLPLMSIREIPTEKTRYYDFTTFGSEGMGRRHGWYDPKTRLITQVG